jgi:hypothetical protein
MYPTTLYGRMIDKMEFNRAKGQRIKEISGETLTFVMDQKTSKGLPRSLVDWPIPG